MEKLDALNRLLDYMETNIDLEHIAKIEQLQIDAMHFREIPHLPLTIRNTPDGYDQIPLEQAFNNPEYMLYNEILWSTMHSSYNSVRTKDDSPLMIRANLGLGIIASAFGCKVSLFDNAMPWVTHLEPEQAAKVISRGVPDYSVGLVPQTIEFYQYFADRLSAYPKCAKAIHLTQPDMQGPYDNYHLVMGEEAFYSVYDDPQATLEALQVMTDTYIDLRKKLAPFLTGSTSDGMASFVHGFTVGGQVLLKCDTAAANLSPEMCREFECDFNKKIFDAFADADGGSTHTCGKVHPDTLETFIATGTKSFNFGNPEKHDVNEVYEKLSAHNINIVGWGFNQFYDEYHAQALDGRIKTGMSLMAKARSVEEAKQFLHQHRGY